MTKDERIALYKGFMPEDVRYTEQMDALGFFDKPASIKYHGAYSGGLFDHSFAVAVELVKLTEKMDLKWERWESPYVVGMYHDLCKCDNYVFCSGLKQFDYNSNIIIPGHGEKSVIMLGRYIDLTDEEIACIRWHMGAYETDTKMWDYYDHAIRKYPNVLYSHTADMIASKILDV